MDYFLFSLHLSDLIHMLQDCLWRASWLCGTWFLSAAKRTDEHKKDVEVHSDSLLFRRTDTLLYT